ncbi:DNA-binding protein [Methylorubrum zatmanii]|nr:DNA-binding protein [Methylorubrum zatmanii]ARO54007.1 DNA-binding protein [Methylorubrum zatmanii]
MRDDKIIEGPAGEQPERAAGSARSQGKRRGLVIGAIAAPLALGAAGLSLAQPGQTLAPTPVAPIAISALAPSGAVAARGEVTEIFGNKFLIQDGTGRALVETGRDGENGGLVMKGETVTVQGRFEKGFLHAKLITHADGKQVVLGRPGGPPAGSADWAKDKLGLSPKLDLPALTAAVEKAGYRDVRVTGRGPRHLEVAAKGADGGERLLHVDLDGRIRERPLL